MSYHGVGAMVSASASIGTPRSSGGGCISEADRARFASDCEKGIMPIVSCPIGRARVCDAPSAPSAGPACVTRAQQNIAKATCIAFRLNCDYKDKPICGTAMPVIVAPTKTAISPEAAAAAQTFLRVPATARTTSGGAPVKATLTTSDASGRFAKLPVPAAAPVVTSSLPAVEPDAGIPMWVWIAGGAAVLGTGAYLYSRRKGA